MLNLLIAFYDVLITAGCSRILSSLSLVFFAVSPCSPGTKVIGFCCVYLQIIFPFRQGTYEVQTSERAMIVVYEEQTMDSPKKEVSSAATPREVDLFAEEALEEVFETIDSLRAQFDQLQIHCEKLAAEKAQVDQLLIDKETEYQRTKELLQEDVSNLRKVNLQLLALQKAFAKGETGINLKFTVYSKNDIMF